MFLVSLSFMDRIKKYLINLLLSLWLFVGEILLMIIVTVPFADAKWGLGFLLGLVSSAALSLVSLVASFRDKTDKVHKIKVWYKGISTLIMIINVPSLFLELTVLFVFRDIFFMLSFFNIIGLIALIAATAISAYVTIKEFFGIHKYGFLHFLTGILTLVALTGIFYKSGTSGILIALILSIAFALLWGLMGAAAVFVINKQK